MLQAWLTLLCHPDTYNYFLFKLLCGSCFLWTKRTCPIQSEFSSAARPLQSIFQWRGYYLTSQAFNFVPQHETVFILAISLMRWPLQHCKHLSWMLTCSRFISFRSFLSKGKFLKVRFGPRWNSLVTLRDVHPQFLKYDLIIASELCFQTDSSISQDEFSLGRRKPILSCLIANLFFFAALCLLAAVDLKAWALFFPLLDAARDDKEKAFILLRWFSHIVTPFFLFTCTICEKLLL